MKCKHCGKKIRLNNRVWWHYDYNYPASGSGYRYCSYYPINLIRKQGEDHKQAEPSLKYFRKLKLKRINEIL
jgi:hypothetical protein